MAVTDGALNSQSVDVVVVPADGRFYSQGTDVVSAQVPGNLFSQSTDTVAQFDHRSRVHTFWADSPLGAAHRSRAYSLHVEAVGPGLALAVEEPATNDVWVWDGATEVPANVTVWNGTAEVAAGVEVV